ncbi:hypothetical protein A1351_08585 [Methylosinus sp. R-45379]|uniref:hypothetical protein n=1 Tax=Methylosinus sp. R-45379 TaxID=980563 RepID=UPI0007D79DBB|nr:hypothetical protein [Methylosinus sp. R-45379]OAI30548.1 hypothetical protein A1351_08585 [Methylosinus sp. R-45379]
MSDETTSTTSPQAEPISTVDLIHFSGLSPERWRALTDEKREEWIRAFRASGAPAGVAELAQGRRRK